LYFLQFPRMNSTDHALLEQVLKQRQLALWNLIRRHYDVSDTLNRQVHLWIRKGEITEKAYTISQRRLK
jgi:hypothetical protein